MTDGLPAALKDGNFGKPVKRREDSVLLQGRGTFSDDIKPAGMLYAAVLRSPHAHARLVSVDVSAANAAPGVRLVLTGRDVLGRINSIHPNWLVGDIEVPDRPVLAHHTVRFVGDPVAFIVAESRAQALDAVELVDVEYEVLPAIVDEVSAYEDDSVQLHENVPRNRVGEYGLSVGDYAAARESAHKVVEFRLVNNRLIPSPLEPRTIVAEYDPFTDHATIHLPSQVPHLHRRWIAETLMWPEHRLRINAPHIGGGFGAKMHLYPEELLVPYAAKLLATPVKWTETRSESHVSTTHGRAHTEFIEVAVDRAGKVLGMNVVTYANMGAYLSNMATGIPTINCAHFVTGCYDINVASVTVHLVVTNTVPVDAYRGAGRPEAAYIIERTMDQIAYALDLDPVEVRKANLLRSDQFPHMPFDHPAIGFDAGDYQATLNRTIEMLDLPKWRERQKQARAEGRYIGIGITNYNESCGVGPSTRIALVGFDRGGYESVQIRVHSDGKVTVFSGSMPQGHGHATAFAQIVSSVLQVPMDDVEVVQGDTDRIPAGIGTYNSRSMPVGGTAAFRCAERLLKKARKFAAVWFDVPVEQVAYENGIFFADGDVEMGMTFAEVARMCSKSHFRPQDETPGLDEVLIYDPVNMSAPSGTHAAVVEVDVDTGETTILAYVATDDIGNVINPLTAEGQVHGGIAQGIGQALFEEAKYDETGQLVSGSLLDYALPKSDHLPQFHTAFVSTPTKTNPLGVKGVGEAGACAAPPAIVAAVCDALKPFGIRNIDMPLTAPKVWSAITAARTHQSEPQQAEEVAA